MSSLPLESLNKSYEEPPLLLDRPDGKPRPDVSDATNRINHLTPAEWDSLMAFPQPKWKRCVLTEFKKDPDGVVPEEGKVVFVVSSFDCEAEVHGWMKRTRGWDTRRLGYYTDYNCTHSFDMDRQEMVWDAPKFRMVGQFCASTIPQ